MQVRTTLVAAAIVSLALVAKSTQADPPLSPGEHDQESIAQSFDKPGCSPYAGRNFPTHVYFGDTHLHTALSGDAFGFGNKLNDEDALRFARGEEITSPGGLCVKLSRPLDFLVVADHAEAYGAMIEIYAGNQTVMSDPKVKRWYGMLHAGGEQSFKAPIHKRMSIF